MLAGALFIAPVGIPSAGTALLQPAILPGVIGVAILSSALPYSMEMVALKRLPARTFGVLLSLAPALGALSGLVFLGERLLVMQWVAFEHRGCFPRQRPDDRPQTGKIRGTICRKLALVYSLSLLTLRTG